MNIIIESFMNIDINKSFAKFQTQIKLIPTKLQAIKDISFKITNINVSNIEI